MKNGFRNWSDVRVFLAVIREGSTLAASRKLGLAQPTVARRIDALEHEIGLTLFERDTRGFRPTEAARELVSFAEQIEAAALRFSETAQDLGHTRPVRITAFSGNLSPKVTSILSEFSLKRPDVPFELLPGVKVLDLAAGEADIALRLVRSSPDPDLICRRISTAKYAIYGSPAYADRHGLPASVEDLGNHTFVSFYREDLPSVVHDWLAAHVRPDQILRTYSEFDLLLAAVRAGHALSIINVRFAESDGGFVQCFGPIEELSAEHMLLVSPAAYRRPEVREFVNFFAPRYAAIFK